MVEDKKDLREIATKLAIEQGEWTDCAPLITEIGEALKTGEGSYQALEALDKISMHIKAIEDERWELVSNMAAAKAALWALHSQAIKVCMDAFVAGIKSITETLRKALLGVSDESLTPEAKAIKEKLLFVLKIQEQNEPIGMDINKR